MIKQLKQANNIKEANELLDRGWVLLSSNNNVFILGAKEEVWEKEKRARKEWYEMTESKKCSTDKAIVERALKNLEITVTKDSEIILSLVGDEVILKNGYEITIEKLS